ncbi:hypothetical protein A3A14_04390 [Candidatus Daviesbacteria bacterium RIFCSPLOWO2_01_FULL_43_38]|uniref:Poly A polymerase head domain-containing protein n=1 Tax=Candidatus Daviesbacteria bacterium RIFCSPHIGHO2_12_FULL_43_11 TaxID=1797780 RepID=A0A1F5K022_9BACT|nr:MAG: hypothetical protein A3E45_04730 [Candidatus Daviesbacteria bacterium RIFCSPHIGHO2_12_FULL_43_11]OGE63771.1 MAG: hypothetical protein A3A14_04390 [Candidatus Daviesbacteria bacterium RIFCSPLOWO2_01_FULL_43_38]OGE69280.1 MAG: hypothetical protein A3J21_01500 [Candidatus Daviesbacteria bacterium RIFCSPLOWO2_02_FULL_43_11]
MLTEQELILKFKQHPELQKRVGILKIASEINPDFKNPHIIGGYLRDLVLGVSPSDCDVFFEGHIKYQPGIKECIRAAEDELKITHYHDWEFENTLVTGVTDNLLENTIGYYSNHTDHLTMMAYDGHGNLRIGSSRTLHDLETRTYDVRYQGMLIWTIFRDRTFYSVLAGVATRGLYLCHKLGLNPSAASEELFRRFEFHFERLEDKDKQARIRYWNKKTKNLKGVEAILEKYDVKSLSF